MTDNAKGRRLAEYAYALPRTRWNASVTQRLGRASLLGRLSYYSAPRFRVPRADSRDRLSRNRTAAPGRTAGSPRWRSDHSQADPPALVGDHLDELGGRLGGSDVAAAG